MISKDKADYRISLGTEQCENCIMFKSGSCDLVVGLIESYAVCDYWEQNPGDITSVALHLERYV